MLQRNFQSRNIAQEHIWTWAVWVITINGDRWGRLKSAIFYRYISETVHASFSEILNCVSLLWLRCRQPLFRQHHFLTGTNMRSIEWWCFQWPYVTLTTSKHPTGAFPLKRAPSSAGIWTPSNARFIGLTPVRSSNAMSIVQPFFCTAYQCAENTYTDRQTDRHTDRRFMPATARVWYSKGLNSNPKPTLP